MAIQMTVQTLQKRFSLPLELLEEVLREGEVPTGSLAELDPFVERLESSEVLADSLTAILRTVTEDDGAPLTRLDMLDLLCLAVSGSDVQSSGPESRHALRQILVFVNGVLLSMRRPPMGADEGEHMRRAASVSDQMEEHVEDFDTPENYYVVENFALNPAQEPSAITPTIPASQAPALAAERISEPLDEYVNEIFVADPARIAERSQDVPATAPPTFRAAFDAHESPFVVSATADGQPAAEEAERERNDSDFEEFVTPASPKRGLLSQSALLACAFVMGFVGGMLVPRGAGGKQNAFTLNPRASMELGNPTRQRMPQRSGTVRLAGVSSPSPRLASRATPAASVQDSATTASTGEGLLPTPAQAYGQGAERPLSQPISVHGGDSSAGGSPSAYLAFGNGTAMSVAPNVALTHLVRSPQPDYPTIAKLTNLRGDIVLAIVISTRGEVIASRVLQGHPLLRGAAETAVRRWQFQPFMQNGGPAQVQTSVVVDVQPPR